MNTEEIDSVLVAFGVATTQTEVDPQRRWAACETVRQFLAALRASAAPEEGRNRTPLAFHDKTALDAAHEIEAMPSDLHEAQKTARIQLIVLKAIIAALPSDSGKAAPVAVKREDMVMRQPDLSDASRYTNNDIAQRMWQSYNSCGDRWFQYAAQRLVALAPATEGGGRGAPGENAPCQLEDLPLYWTARANALRIVNAARIKPDMGTQEQLLTYEECAGELRAALSPSPLVGTPAQPVPSADREAGQ